MSLSISLELLADKAVYTSGAVADSMGTVAKSKCSPER